jgi:hypothetical protein
MARRGTRLGVIVKAKRLHAIAQPFLLPGGGIALRCDLGLSLQVRRFGVLEDVDDVLALGGDGQYASAKTAG